MGSLSCMNLYVGFDCCRVLHAYSKLTITEAAMGKGTLAEDSQIQPTKEGCLTVQYAARSGEMGFASPDEDKKMPCSDFTFYFLMKA